MERFRSQVTIAADSREVIDLFWNPAQWPRVASHVQGIDCLYGDDHAQVLLFSVRTASAIDVFKSVRIRHGNRILFYQPVPPPFLPVHSGSWTFDPADAGTVVTVEHSVAVDAPLARARFSDREASDAAVIARVVEIITHNSLQTMQALKACLERAKESVHAASIH